MFRLSSPFTDQTAAAAADGEVQEVEHAAAAAAAAVDVVYVNLSTNIPLNKR